MFHSSPKFVASAAILLVAIAASCNAAVAQEQIFSDNQAVKRVIKLQQNASGDIASTEAPTDATTEAAAAAPAVAATKNSDPNPTARRQATPVSGPPKIEFDLIGSSRAKRDTPVSVADQPSTQTITKADATPIAPTVSTNWESPTLDIAAPKPVVSSEQEQISIQRRSNLLSTEIKSPKFVNVNQPAKFMIKIRNEGMDSVENVKLVAQVPMHTRLASASQSPAQSAGQIHEFAVTAIAAKSVHEIRLDLVPTEKKPFEIATRVIVENEQRTSVAVRQPVLSLALNGPKQMNIGQNVTHELIITNDGDGSATDVHVHALFPEQLNPLDSSADPVIPIIEPGNSVSVAYQSQAIAPGPVELRVDAEAEGAEPKQVTMDFRVFQPELRVSAVGPKLNYVSRDGIYTISIDNTGEADVTDVKVSLAVPNGMDVTTISREAAVDAKRGTLTWVYPKISSNSTERIQLKATARTPGVQVCNIQISSNETPDKEIRLLTNVVTRADLSIRIKNLTGPVQVGGKAEFLVEVENQGSRKASDVNVHVALPESLMPVNENKVSADQAANGISLVKSEVAPGQKVTFKFTAVGVVEGEHVVRSTLQATDSQRQLISEDVVLVYEVAESRVSESVSGTVRR